MRVSHSYRATTTIIPAPPLLLLLLLLLRNCCVFDSALFFTSRAFYSGFVLLSEFPGGGWLSIEVFALLENLCFMVVSC